jgi:hypothetical protein
VNERYVEECGACHMAYPPGLLPARSWKKLMADLGQHFGEDAELEPKTAAALTRYLVEHSADGSDYRRSRKVARSLAKDRIPLRITELSFFRHEHGEIPDQQISNNPEVGNLSNCVACHRRAEQGSFSEREIRIPNYGQWDD